MRRRRRRSIASPHLHSLVFLFFSSNSSPLSYFITSSSLKIAKHPPTYFASCPLFHYHLLFFLFFFLFFSSLPFSFRSFLFNRCPLTMDGGGSMATGTIYGTKQKFKNDPVATFDQYGYTEYLELEYDQSVYGKSRILCSASIALPNLCFSRTCYFLCVCLLFMFMFLCVYRLFMCISSFYVCVFFLCVYLLFMSVTCHHRIILKVLIMQHAPTTPSN